MALKFLGGQAAFKLCMDQNCQNDVWINNSRTAWPF